MARSNEQSSWVEDITGLTSKDVTLLAASTFITWAIFPEKPKLLDKLFEHPIYGIYVKWFAVYALIYQSSAKSKHTRAILGILIAILLKKFLDNLYEQSILSDKDKQHNNDDDFDTFGRTNPSGQ